MKIQLNTDVHIDGTEALAAQVGAQAIHGAEQKLVHLLDSMLGRLHDHREKAPDPPLSGTETVQR